jgi:hypothetical protein
MEHSKFPFLLRRHQKDGINQHGLGKIEVHGTIKKPILVHSTIVVEGYGIVSVVFGKSVRISEMTTWKNKKLRV